MISHEVQGGSVTPSEAALHLAEAMKHLGQANASLHLFGSDVTKESTGGHEAPRQASLPASSVPLHGEAIKSQVAETVDQSSDESESRDNAPGQEWKEFFQEDSDDKDSGEDSDELPSAQQADRRRNDMDVLFRQRQTLRCSVPPRSSPTSKASASAQSTLDTKSVSSPSNGTNPKAGDGADAKETVPSEATTVDCSIAGYLGPSSSVADEESDDGEDEDLNSASPDTKRKSLMARLFKSKSGGRDKQVSAITAELRELETGHLSMLKDDKVMEHDESWYRQELSVFQRDGLACTKVATNGKPYDRRIHIDARNLTVEIRGGRTGEKGIMLDDLVDIKRGLGSAEFELFYVRIGRGVDLLGKKYSWAIKGKELSARSCVLVTPHRTFSFIFPTQHLRENLGQCIRFLLMSKNRGVLATGGSDSTKSVPVKGPREGNGLVRYPNRSTYEGQFQNGKRHGFGVLTLSDGTRYEAEWRNDERHGEGKEFCPDGTTFKGCYLKGMRHGNGEMTWPEGSKYSGQFERGRANGDGQLLRTDGSVYQGQFAEDCMSGEGRMEWRDGVAYTGQFSANRREGFGKMKWSTGRWASYEGDWKDGLQCGEGTLINHEKQAFRGIFRAGKLERWLDDT